MQPLWQVPCLQRNEVGTSCKLGFWCWISAKKRKADGGHSVRSGANAALRKAVEIGGGLISIVSSLSWWMRQLEASRYGGVGGVTTVWRTVVTLRRRAAGAWVLCGIQYPVLTARAYSALALLGAVGGCSTDEEEGQEGIGNRARVGACIGGKFSAI